MKRYEVQKIESKFEGTNFRITDTHGDNRIGTSYDENHADLIVEALNFYEENKGKTTKKKRKRNAKKC